MRRGASKKIPAVDIRFITNNELADETHGTLIDFINWQPLYNLYATPDGIIIHLELAGVDLEDIVIYLHSRYMVVIGNRQAPAALTRNSCVFHTLEVAYGRFRRRIDFPVPVEIRQYQHEVRNGMLTLHFKAVKEKLIPIEGA
jgi:HSP20 family molecular chaperone IbpA